MDVQLVRICWHDATSFDKTWKQKKAAKKLSLCEVISTGYLVQVTDEFISIAQSYDEDNHYWDFLNVPWGMVQWWEDA